MNSLSILIADDHEVVRRGIRTLLEARPEWRICGEAATGREAIEKAKRLRPDLLVLDITMPDLDGLEAIPALLAVCPSVRILVLTMHDSGDTAARALAMGASGLVLKSDAGRDLVRAVQAMEKGQSFLSPAVTKIIAGHLAKTSSPGPSPEDLTARELEVLKLLAHGRSNKEAATALDISVKTVDAHRASIMRRLNLNTYSELIHFAIRHKIIEI
ncbi:MAG TPA: response regulator transcription factor [Bryobacteraceae bacterium]|jgi:DNA-binding NarL/FixJ family response regulator|nr:response regulator transcription factor [Bryobacteraceae bacterium]